MSAYTDQQNASGNCRNGSRGQRAPWHPVELVAMVLGFMWFWPVGLAILGLKMWQRKTGAQGDLASVARTAYARSQDWAQNTARDWNTRGPVWAHNASSAGSGFGFTSGMNRTGNSAFDDWRAGELTKLEEERKRLADAEREFADHIDGLRRARDRDEFDRFMAARNGVSPTQPGTAS